MPTTLDLQRKAREFGEQLNDLLNATILDGPRLTTIVNTTGDRAWIGYGLAKQEVVPTTAMPITISGAPPRAFLHVYHVLTLEPETDYLTSARGEAGVYLDAAKTRCFCRYDYERDKGDGYPESHLHVYGQSAAPAQVGVTSQAREHELGDLHFPLGGRRFRPGLEDLIDFLVTEDLALAKPGYTDAIESSRQRFFEIQLMAAARRFPEVAQRGVDRATPTDA